MILLALLAQQTGVGLLESHANDRRFHGQPQRFRTLHAILQHHLETSGPSHGMQLRPDADLLTGRWAGAGNLVPIACRDCRIDPDGEHSRPVIFGRTAERTQNFTGKLDGRPVGRPRGVHKT